MNLKHFFATMLSLILSTSVQAQATREDIQQALHAATMASMFAIKAQMCNWENGGMDWNDLRIHSVAFSLATMDAGKKLNLQQTTAISLRVTEPAALAIQRSVVEKAMSKGVCTDKEVPTNEGLWLRTIDFAKSIKNQARDNRVPAAESSIAH